MANYDFNVGVTDEGGNKSSISGFLVAADDAAAQAAIVDALEKADLIIGGVINQAVSLTKTLDISAATLKTVPAAGSDVLIKSKWTFGDGAGHTKLMTLPTFADDTYGTADRTVDMTVTQTQNFRDSIISGGFGTNRYEDLTTLIKAVEYYGK